MSNFVNCLTASIQMFLDLLLPLWTSKIFMLLLILETHIFIAHRTANEL